MLGSTEKQDSSGHSNPGNSESKLCMPNALPMYMYMYTPGVVHVSTCTMANVSRSIYGFATAFEFAKNIHHGHVCHPWT